MIISSYVLITILLSGLYVFLLSYLLQKWSELEAYEEPIVERPTLTLSIIIPARNEASRIASCLDSVVRNIQKSTHQVEVIVIDDHSSDDTASITRQYAKHGVKLLQLHDFLVGTSTIAYKKAALAYGVSKAEGSYVIQLDADVVLHENYIETISSAIINTGADFIAAPVIFSPDRTLLEHFQCLDMLGMMTLTGAGIFSKNWFMANGANMIYKKKHADYTDLKMASGDDIFTIQEISKDPTAIIQFLKSSQTTVKTSAETTYTAFWKQRIRWATKNRQMKNPKMLAMMLVPFFNALWLLVHLCFLFINVPLAIVLGAFHVLSLMAMDYLYLRAPAHYYQQTASLRFFVRSFFCHKLYLTVIGLAGLVVTKYTWKGRAVR